MERYSVFFYQKKQGFSTIELMLAIPLIAIVTYGLFSVINKISVAAKKTEVLKSMTTGQGVATQNFLRSGQLNESLKFNLGDPQYNLLKECFAGSGVDCQAKFSASKIILALDPSDARSAQLMSDLGAKFGSQLQKCEDPQNCNTLYEQKVEAAIECPSTVSCTQIKLSIISDYNEDNKVLSTPVSDKKLELYVPAQDLIGSGLSGLCTSDQGFVDSINLGSNTINCKKVSETVPDSSLSKACGTPTFDATGQRILAGIATTGFDNGTACQELHLENWTEAAGYPSDANPRPSAEKTIQLTEPSVTKIKLVGDLNIIIDDSASLANIKSKVVEGLRLVLDKAVNNSDLRIRLYTTDTFIPLEVSNAVSEAQENGVQISVISNAKLEREFAGVKQHTITNAYADKIDTTYRTSINYPFLDVSTSANNSTLANTITSSINGLRFAKGEASESGACSLMRLMQDRIDNPASYDSNRKSLFLLITDEPDAFEKYWIKHDNDINRPSTVQACIRELRDFHQKKVEYRVLKIHRRFDNFSNVVSPNFKATDVQSFKNNRPEEATLKQFFGRGLVAEVKYNYKYKSFDNNTSVKTSAASVYIKAAEYGVTSPSETCPSDLWADLKKYFKAHAKEIRNLHSNRYYTSVNPAFATADEIENVDFLPNACRIYSNWIPVRAIAFKRTDFPDANSFFNFNFFKPGNKSSSNPVKGYNWTNTTAALDRVTGDWPAPELFDDVQEFADFHWGAYTQTSIADRNRMNTSDFGDRSYLSNKSTHLSLRDFIVPSESLVIYLKDGEVYSYNRSSFSPPASLADDEKLVTRDITKRYKPLETENVQTWLAKTINSPLPPTSIEKPLVDLLKMGLENIYGSNYAISAIIHEKDTNTVTCTGDKAAANTVFRDLVSKLGDHASLTNICDFDKVDPLTNVNKYEQTFSKIADFFKTYTDVGAYVYEYPVNDPELVHSLKNFLKEKDIDELEFELKLKISENATSPSETIILSRGADFHVSVLRIEESNPSFKITFVESPRVKELLLKYKYINFKFF